MIGQRIRSGRSASSKPRRGGKRRLPAQEGKASPAMSRTERRLALHVRRARAGLIASSVAAVLIVVAWFPAGAIVAQRKALATSSAKLAAVTQQDRSLIKESHRLSSPAEVARIARDQYQLVYSGERLYEVLPPNSTAGLGTLYPGDPGLSPPVSPSAISELPPSLVPASSTGAGTVAAQSSASRRAPGSSVGLKGTQSSAGSPSFFRRVLDTLEFWR